MHLSEHITQLENKITEVLTERTDSLIREEPEHEKAHGFTNAQADEHDIDERHGHPKDRSMIRTGPYRDNDPESWATPYTSKFKYHPGTDQTDYSPEMVDAMWGKEQRFAASGAHKPGHKSQDLIKKQKPAVARPLPIREEPEHEKAHGFTNAQADEHDKGYFRPYDARPDRPKVPKVPKPPKSREATIRDLQAYTAPDELQAQPFPTYNALPKGEEGKSRNPFRKVKEDEVDEATLHLPQGDRGGMDGMRDMISMFDLDDAKGQGEWSYDADHDGDTDVRVSIGDLEDDNDDWAYREDAGSDDGFVDGSGSCGDDTEVTSLPMGFGDEQAISTLEPVGDMNGGEEIDFNKIGNAFKAMTKYF